MGDAVNQERNFDKESQRKGREVGRSQEWREQHAAHERLESGSKASVAWYSRAPRAGTRIHNIHRCLRIQRKRSVAR